MKPADLLLARLTCVWPNSKLLRKHYLFDDIDLAEIAEQIRVDGRRALPY